MIFYSRPQAWQGRAVVVLLAMVGSLLCASVAVAQAKAKLVIQNNTNEVVAIFWQKDAKSVEISYGTLKPGASVEKQTFTGHHWIFRDKQTGKEIRKFVVTKPSETITVTPRAPRIAAPKATLTILNRSNAPIEVVWLDFGDSHVVKAQKELKTATILGHQLSVRDKTTGKEIRRITVSKPSEVIVISTILVRFTNRTDKEVKFFLNGGSGRTTRLKPGASEEFRMIVDPKVQPIVGLFQADGKRLDFTVVDGKKYAFRIKDGKVTNFFD